MEYTKIEEREKYPERELSQSSKKWLDKADNYIGSVEKKMKVPEVIAFVSNLRKRILLSFKTRSNTCTTAGVMTDLTTH
jgi:hypothetical protein